MTPAHRQPDDTHAPCKKCGEVHTRCAGHRASNGKPCGRHPIHGSSVCWSHGGAAPQVKAAAARRVAHDDAVAEGERILERLGGSLDIDPLDALLGAVREAAANVAVYRIAIEGLGVKVADDAWATDAVAFPERVIEFEKGGTHVPARVHILVDLYNQERDRLVKYAKLCLDAGVEERRVRVAEADAQRLAAAFAGALDDVGELMPDDLRAAVRTALGARLRAITAGA